MRHIFLPANAKTVWVRYQAVFCTAMLGLVVSFQMPIMSSQAQTGQQYAQTNPYGYNPQPQYNQNQGYNNQNQGYNNQNQGYNNQNQGYNNNPTWRNPPPRRYRPQNNHVAWCSNRYRSYNPATDTYLGYDGYNHTCVSPGRKPALPVYNNQPRYNQPRRNPQPTYNQPKRRQSGNYSCSQAKRLIERQGYNNVRAKNCNDFGRYTFYAWYNGLRYRLRIRANDGVIYKRSQK